jgi:hypothetical protein
VAGVAAGADHRDAHALLAQPGGRVVDECEPDAVALGGGIDGEHLDLPSPRPASATAATAKPATVASSSATQAWPVWRVALTCSLW